MTQDIFTALEAVRVDRQWRTGKLEEHLVKRKSKGHLSPEATLDDYDHIIETVLNDTQAQVYLYWRNQVPYICLVAVTQSNEWLVMFGFDGIMETAFAINRPNYLEHPDFELIGIVSEI